MHHARYVAMLTVSDIECFPQVWDSAECAHLGTLTGHSSSVNSVVSHCDGKLTLTASSDRTVKVRHARFGRFGRAPTYRAA